MAVFLDTHGIANALNQVVTKAQRDIVLITPYISFPTILFERLLDADERGVKTTLVFGKTQLKKKEMDKLAELELLSVYFLENLHAKCNLNEDLLVISSMNLYDYSEKNNREMGILLRKKEDTTLFKDAWQEYESILKASDPVFKRRQKKHQSKVGTGQGHCLRCNADTSLNPSAPYCKECFSSWFTYKNRDYREKHCHVCGTKATASMNMPTCQKC